MIQVNFILRGNNSRGLCGDIGYAIPMNTEKSVSDLLMNAEIAHMGKHIKYFRIESCRNSLGQIANTEIVPSKMYSFEENKNMELNLLQDQSICFYDLKSD